MPEFKYNLNEQFEQLPKNITWNDIYKHAKKCGISMRTFQADKSIQRDSDQDIPTERLLKYAVIFNCTVADLVNYKVKAKPLKV